MSCWVLVPAKDPRSAKHRMSPVLDLDERALLAGAMLEDLSRVLRSVDCPVALTTNSPAARGLAEEARWRVFWETSPVSESASVDLASSRLASEGVDAVLRLPADIPLVEPGDVQALLDAAAGPGSALLVPSRDGLGTNALLRTPPDLFPSRFGSNSLVLHCQEARRYGSDLSILENPRIALDLDDPGDIEFFMRKESATSTFRLLSKLAVSERLALHAKR